MVALDGYVRVSQVRGRGGERFISPVVQREQIEAWALSHRVAIGEMFEELDESGGRADRPLLQRALGRVESGESGGVVVAKLDRFGRSLIDGLAAIERISRAGGTFVAVQDGLDITTPTGRLVLRVMLSMAEWELDRIRDQWDWARARAVARGAYLSPRPPTGYRRPKSRLIVDGHDGPVISELFRRAAAGAGHSELARFLEASQVVTPYGNTTWTPGSVTCLVHNRAYLGESRHGEHVNTSAHERLTDPATWLAAQRPRRLAVYPARVPALLRGLVRCASCRMVMHAFSHTQPDGKPRVMYRCPRVSAAGRCPAPAAINGASIESIVERWLHDHARRVPRPNTSTLRRRERDADRLETDLIAYRDSTRALTTLGTERFADGLAERQRRLDTALLKVAAARAQTQSRTSTIDDWPTLDTEARRQLVGGLIDCLFVRAGKPSDPDRVTICARGEAPIDLPRRGRHDHVLRPYDPADTERKPTPCPPVRPWPISRLTTELDAALDGHTAWPEFEHFDDISRSDLRDQIVFQAGPFYWARRYALPYTVWPPSQPWTDERVRASLAIAIRHCHRFPSYREMVDLGLGALPRKLRAHGGQQRWAEEFGLPIRRTVRHWRWTDEKIAEALAELTESRQTYPSPAEFRAAGLAGLHAAIQQGDGPATWAQRLGLPRQRPQTIETMALQSAAATAGQASKDKSH